MKPPCYNRPPFAEGRWHYTGEWRRGKPVMRWYPRWFVDRCATHDGVGIGPNNEGYPAAHGWDCSGCRHDPRSLTSNLAMFAEGVEYAVRETYGIDIVEDPSVPPGMIAVSVPYSIGKSESPVRFFHVSGDMNAIPDDGRRWQVVEIDTPYIDAFEPIQRAKSQAITAESFLELAEKASRGRDIHKSVKAITGLLK